jgi:hypothetical protein
MTRRLALLMMLAGLSAFVYAIYDWEWTVNWLDSCGQYRDEFACEVAAESVIIFAACLLGGLVIMAAGGAAYQRAKGWHVLAFQPALHLHPEAQPLRVRWHLRGLAQRRYVYLTPVDRRRVLAGRQLDLTA